MIITYYIMFIQFVRIFIKSHIDVSNSYKLKLSKAFLEVICANHHHADQNCVQRTLKNVSHVFIVVFILVQLTIFVLTVTDLLELNIYEI